VEIYVPSEATCGVGARFGISPACVLHGLAHFFELAARLYQVGKCFRLSLRDGEPLTAWELGKIAERFEMITTLILVISASDPSSCSLTSRRPIAEETPWPNALPVWLTLSTKRI